MCTKDSLVEVVEYCCEILPCINLYVCVFDFVDMKGIHMVKPTRDCLAPFIHLSVPGNLKRAQTPQDSTLQLANNIAGLQVALNVTVKLIFQIQH